MPNKITESIKNKKDKFFAKKLKEEFYEIISDYPFEIGENIEPKSIEDLQTDLKNFSTDIEDFLEKDEMDKYKNSKSCKYCYIISNNAESLSKTNNVKYFVEGISKFPGHLLYMSNLKFKITEMNNPLNHKPTLRAFSKLSKVFQRNYKKIWYFRKACLEENRKTILEATSAIQSFLEDPESNRYKKNLKKYLYCKDGFSIWRDDKFAEGVIVTKSLNKSDVGLDELKDWAKKTKLRISNWEFYGKNSLLNALNNVIKKSDKQ